MPKTKRQRQKQAWRRPERQKRDAMLDRALRTVEGEVWSQHGDTDIHKDNLACLPTMSEDALETDDEAVYPIFDLDSSMKLDVDHLIEIFCEDCTLKEMTECH